MFFRTKETKTGKALQLVHNYRDKDNKVRQKVVVSLGNMPVPAELQKEIAKEVENALNGQKSLFPLLPEIANWTDKIVSKINYENRWKPGISVTEISYDEEVADGVPVDRIEHENETELGTLLVLQKAWEELGLSNTFSAAGLSRRQINAAKVSVFNRLIEPVSENELPRWVETMSFNELLEANINIYAKDTYYRISDIIIRSSEVIESSLRKREADLFNLDRTIVLYDLTNTYFEGKCGRNPKARRGHSKEKRTDCPLLSLGISVDAKGFILSHQIFEGNLHDAKSLTDMVCKLDKAYGESSGTDKRVVIVDGGIATEENLKYLRSNGYEYIVAGKRQSRNNFYDDFCDDDAFTLIPDREGKKDVYVARKEDNGELKVLCRSEQRKEKENAILSKTEEKYITELHKLNERLRNPKSHLKKAVDVERAIGKINAKYSRASKFYNATFNAEDKSVVWKRNDEKYRAAKNLNGCYLLRSSLTDITEYDVWQYYSTLTKVEHAFEMMKTFLGIRPVRHHTEERCDAHIFITVIAYHLMRYIEEMMDCAGSPTTWWNLRRVLQTHCYSTLIVPSKDGVIRYIRKAGRPDERQRSIYNALNIDYKKLPKKKEFFQQK